MGWMKSGSTCWAGHPSPSRLFPVTPWRKLDVWVQETLLCRYVPTPSALHVVVSFLRWDCFVEPRAQVDVDRVSERHSTLCSCLCGKNVVALCLSSGDCFTFE
jgi:hypothetical protein